MERAVLHGVEHARADRHRPIATRASELWRWLGDTVEVTWRETWQHLADRGCPGVVSPRQVGVGPGGVELSVPLAVDLAPAGERQHPELPRADQVGGQSEE